MSSPTTPPSLRNADTSPASQPGAFYRWERLFYRCITPVHVGVGQEVGVVDLPIARERATALPIWFGSGLRGALRARVEETVGAELTERLFGPWIPTADRSGCVSVVDAKILFFPVRSSHGIFRWVTCPWVLERYRRDLLALVGANGSEPVGAPQPQPGEYLGEGPDRLFLEEIPFSHGAPGTLVLPEVPALDGSRVVVVADDAFSYFVRLATIVRTRNRLTTAKTVERGHLFSIEELPPETVLYGFLGTTRERRRAVAEAEESAPQAAVGNSGVDSSQMADPPIPFSPQEAWGHLAAALAQGPTGEELGEQGTSTATVQDMAVRTYLIVGGHESVGSGIVEAHWGAS